MRKLRLALALAIVAPGCADDLPEAPRHLAPAVALAPDPAPPPAPAPAAVTPAAAPAPRPADDFDPLPLPPPKPRAVAAADATVYATARGKMYHSEGCRYLAKSSRPLPLGTAAARLSPCSVCKPPEIR